MPLNSYSKLFIRGRLPDGRILTQYISAPAGYHVADVTKKIIAMQLACPGICVDVVSERMDDDSKRLPPT